MLLASRSIPIARPLLLLAFVVAAVVLLVALVLAAAIAGPHLAHVAPSAMHSLLANGGPHPTCSGGTGGSCF